MASAMHHGQISIVVAAIVLSSTTTARAESLPKELVGDWSLELDSGSPGWMRVEAPNGKPEVSIRFYIGPAGPYKDVKVVDGRLKFEIKRRKKNGPISATSVDVGSCIAARGQ